MSARMLATRLLDHAGRAAPMPPITDGDPAFGLAAAYDVAAEIRTMRIGRGERPVGWKIGFTNRRIWDEYGVHAPIWGPMWDSTAALQAPDDPTPCPVGDLNEPRIEPEVVFRLLESPEPGMTPEAVMGCIDGIALGFEIVHSLYPDWRFRPADTVAAFALHGRLRHRPFIRLDAPDRRRWADRLESFTATLSRDGEVMDHGSAETVLGGPLHALKAFVDGLAETPLGPRLQPGEIVTTGTLTRALPIAAGETWRIETKGLDLDHMELTFC